MKTSIAATLIVIFISTVYVNQRRSKSDQMTADQCEHGLTDNNLWYSTGTEISQDHNHVIAS